MSDLERHASIEALFYINFSLRHILSLHNFQTHHDIRP
jgi:hypothetical protein